MIAITVSTDKVTRAIAAQPHLEAGNIHLPGHAAPDTAAGYHAPDWVANLIEEAATFPNGKHDDQVDAFSQAINWAQTKTSTSPGGSWVADAEKSPSTPTRTDSPARPANPDPPIRLLTDRGNVA